ncbi:hypothetical protein ACFPZ0_27775 [Streptomonospora nanhaiensis]|uniref:DUF7691 family protein n=1 Tax=Streptomonospora nanhaiensis TaxID=1323731 RepID=UPI001C39376D|nr:hypothetical protein [Streptomonospora nanhaiensis]MBV2366502.1 hypothetical protein [Streptomonospora nanhaiensis]MBX9391986.1 hypothetical protein [Streptomonospora nanhaiensis]
MSYALTTYVVDLDTLHGAVGSKDDKLRRMIGGRFKRHLAAFDQQFSHVADEGGPGIHDAIRAVIDGGPFDAGHGSMYGYAYKWICEFHGRAQYNNDFSPMRSGWLETVDEGLAAVGVTAVRVDEFSMDRPPAPIPAPDFVPCYGEWSAEECRKAHEQWAAATDDAKAALDREVREAAESCMEWCANAVAAGRGVAGFFS